VPRTSRAIVAGLCYHVINRGNNRAQRFHDRADYDAFAGLMARACDLHPVQIIGFCLMPNHVHLVVWPANGVELARWMHWVFLAYSRRYHTKQGTSGRVWENRYRAFPIQGDVHLLTALRYVERNALRGNLVRRAEDWEWGSLNWRMRPVAPLALSQPPVTLPPDWIRWVNTPQSEEELAALRNCVNRQCPFGSSEWVVRTAGELGMEHTIAPRGRPRSKAEKK
jgi:putative transposase